MSQKSKSVLFLCLILSSCYSTCHKRDHEIAEKNLKHYLKDLDIKIVSEKCSRYDDDNDNYVDCEYKEMIKGPDGIERPNIVYLECWGDPWLENDGCRSPQPKIHVHNTNINRNTIRNK